MLTQQKPQFQTNAPQIWDKPTAKVQIGDYIHAPFVPVMQVVDRDVLSGGQIWLLLKPTTASHTEEWVLEPEADQQQPEPQTEPQQPVPTPETSPKPTPDAEFQFEQGQRHGRNDSLAGWHPIYTQALTEYAKGYLAGYNAGLNPTIQQLAARKPLSWSVCLDPLGEIYQTWVGDRCIGHASTYEEAERKAQAYIATEEMIKQQNRAVLMAYAA